MPESGTVWFSRIMHPRKRRCWGAWVLRVGSMFVRRVLTLRSTNLYRAIGVRTASTLSFTFGDGRRIAIELDTFTINPDRWDTRTVATSSAYLTDRCFMFFISFLNKQHVVDNTHL